MEVFFMQADKLERCVWWIHQGFSILPCQPKKKYLVVGYGEYKARVTTKYHARMMIEKFPSCNVAVLGHSKTIILDFDNPELYTQWASSRPQEAQSYTERTPRGGYHVFLRGERPKGLLLKLGVELKSIVIVAPSVLESGETYCARTGEILTADPVEVFSSLSKPGTPTARRKLIEQAKTYRGHAGGKTLIEQIKADNDILHVFSVYRPEQEFGGQGRYETVICPFHEDHKPSMFLDRQLQIFKCHACGVHGDVINLYANFEGIPVREAVARMARQAVKA
jgi:DNA primase